MGKLMKRMNAVVIIDIIIIYATLFKYISIEMSPKSGYIFMEGFEGFGYFGCLFLAICTFYILAFIHTAMICTEDNEIVLAYARDLKYLAFPFNKIFRMKCIQTILFIIIFVLYKIYRYTYFYDMSVWEVWFGFRIVGLLTSIIFVKYFLDLEYKPTSYLLWIYTTLPITDIWILGSLNAIAEEIKLLDQPKH